MAKRNWEAWEEGLRHPDGRATGGELCVQCGQPVPAGVHWKWRDRHVCSARCNTNLRRRYNRTIASGDKKMPLESPPSITRTNDAMVFRTLEDHPFPYQHAGWSPRFGDEVERHGSITAYRPVQDGGGDLIADRVACLHQQTGSIAVVSVDEQGRQSNGVMWGIQLPGSDQLSEWSAASAFKHDGITWHWYPEIIRSTDDEGMPYTWWATVCGPFVMDSMWTPEYRERSERLSRISASEAAHRRRERVASTRSDRIDPQEVFATDGWCCQLCGQRIVPELRHPDPMSASLDHIVPLAAHGTHTRDNVQAAHLMCNIRKGARLLAEPRAES